jgi:hypothetical protein
MVTLSAATFACLRNTADSAGSGLLSSVLVMYSGHHVLSTPATK